MNKVPLYFAKIGFVDCVDTGKGKCCMWLVKKVEIYFAEIGFVDCKWSNLNAPRSYTPWSDSFLGSILDCPFHWMQEKGNAACGLLKKCKSILQK